MASALIGKMKSAAVSGADATSRAAKTAKYNGDIELLSMKVRLNRRFRMPNSLVL